MEVRSGRQSELPRVAIAVRVHSRRHHRTHRYPAVQAVVSGLVAARPDTVVLEMGLPLWVPPAGVHVATYGAARANAQAAAEMLGLAG